MSPVSSLLIYSLISHVFAKMHGKKEHVFSKDSNSDRPEFEPFNGLACHVVIHLIKTNINGQVYLVPIRIIKAGQYVRKPLFCSLLLKSPCAPDNLVFPLIKQVKISFVCWSHFPTLGGETS